MVKLLRPIRKLKSTSNISLHKLCFQFIKQTTVQNMSDPTQQVSLPQSVDHLINKICVEQNQRPPDVGARHGLASLGEDGALDVLRTIAAQKIKSSFAGFISCLVQKRINNNLSPPKRLSPYSSPPQQETDGVMNQRPILKQQRCSPLSLSSHAVSQRALIPQYVALGELEFRKAFLILSYIGEKCLEEVITADEIRGLKDLQMTRFELEVWNALGRNYIKQEDRRMSLDWDSGKTHFYHCHVSTNGSCTFKGPYLNQTKTHLQRVLGDENILMVKFADEVGARRSFSNWNDFYAKYNEIAREGVLVGLRRYCFFVFKDGGKEEKKKDPTTSPVKCYFVRMESDASVDKGNHYILYGKTVQQARAMFMHVHTVSSVASYMSRLSLVLSKTMKLEVNLSSINIEPLEDVPCCDKDGNIVYKDGEPLIHTDGTGFISEDLAVKCPTYVYKGKCTNADNKRSIDQQEFAAKFSDVAKPEFHCGEPPLLMQVRLFDNGRAVKGTLLVNKKLPPQTIQIRDSMVKVKADQRLSHIQTFNSLEVVKTSNQPRKTYLSKYLIALLSYGGVPENVFVDMLRKALEDAQDVFSNRRSALKVSLNYGGMDDFIAARMISSGISLDEPYLQHHLSILMNEERKSLQAGKLPVTDSYYLMGTVDPTGMLKSDEVCIILNDGQVSWDKVLVYRNPGLHFGDIHVLKATYVKELEDFVGTSKFAIFFPSNGPRSLADEIAGGDFDGDLYFVSRNPELLKHFKESERWMRMTTSTNVSPNKKPSDFLPEELEDELFQLFLNTRFQPSYAKSLAADCWLAIMDRYLTLGDESAAEKVVMKENMLQLINIYYDALDAPKKGGKKIEVRKDLKVEKFPCYMGRDESASFESTSVLGTIYSTVKSYKAVDLSVKEVWKLACFDGGFPEACMTKWKDYYDQYRHEMHVALQNGALDKDDAAEQVIKKYKQILFGAMEFEQSTRSVEEVYNEALAIYNVTYNYARSKRAVSYCSFAWKVAGSALCKLYALKQGESSMLCSASVLKEVCG